MKDGYIQGTSGRLYFRRNELTVPKKGQVLVIHGYGEHCARYDALLESFAAAGLDALAFDHVGHGKSDGLRGMINRFDDYLDDALIAHRALGGGQKTIIFGHSMGGLIALRLVLRNPEIASALMLSAPYLKRALKASAIKIGAGHLLGKLVPKLALASGLKGEHVTHDPKEAALYDNDPLLISKVRAGWFVAVEAAMAEVPNLVSSLNLPIYWTHGEMDPVASFDQSRAVFDKITTKNKTFVPLAGMRHEPLHEIDRAKVVRELTTWAAAQA